MGKELVNPFKPATEVQTRCKLFVWGDTGAGKTWLSLQFPGVVMLDFDTGYKMYSKMFKFDVMECYSLDKLQDALNYLAAGNHNFQTLVIDPISILCDMHLAKWNDIYMEYNTSSKTHKGVYYTFSQRDWGPVKNDFKRLIRLINALDMNVIATAREKSKYEKYGSEIREVGVTFDAEKNLKYEFDSNIQLVYDPIRDTRKAVLLKDRGGLIASAAGGLKIFPVDYSVFERAYPNLADKSNKSLATEEQIYTFNTYITHLNLRKEDLAKRFQELGVNSFEELDIMEAQEVLKKLERAYNKVRVI